jgi:pilus assembly protein FimV
MSWRYVIRFLVLAGLTPGLALALGLGDIHLKSTLNAPLDAEIDLSATPEELAGLKVALASRESFARYGLDYPAYLGSVTLLPAKSADGHDVVHARSTDPVTEPFATLLVEATWARGRLVREYTVLLDPPVTTGANPAAAAAVASPSTAPASHSGQVAPAAMPAPEAAAPATSAQPASQPAAAVNAGGGTYTVQRGDTLSAIAAHNFPNNQRERALVAIYQANPKAFEGNMNVLHNGAQLVIPDAAAVAAVGPADAHALVGTEYREWSGTHGGRLRLVAPSESATPEAAGHGGGAAASEVAALQKKLTDTQAQLNESHRLLDLKNAELARLQAQLDKSHGASQAPAASAANPKATPAPAAAPVPAPTPVPAPATQAKPAPPEASPPAAQKPAAAPPPAPEGPSLLDTLVANWYLLLGALVLVVGGFFGLKAWKARAENVFDHTMEQLTTPPETATAKQRTAETAPIRSLAGPEPSILVEESGTHQALRSGERPAAAAAPHVDVDDTLAGESAVAIDQGDPLAEADFHMAYGLYDQAADLVRIAIQREPDRRDLKLKLLEVYFVWGNRDQFLQLAHELSATRDQSGSGEWEKVVIMGRQIAPDDPLFASGGPLAGAASAGVDLNLEGGQNRIDFDLLGEPSLATESHADGVDLDLGAALPTGETTGEARKLGDTGVDFVLDDPARGGDATGSTREMPQSNTVTLDMGGTDSPTVENPQAEHLDNPTIRHKLEATGRNQMLGTEATAELSIDDLGLEITGSADAPHESGAGDTAITAAPTMISSLDEDTREMLAGAAAGGHNTSEMPAIGSGASGTWLFTDKDISSVLPAMDMPGGATQTALRPEAMPTAVMAAPDATIGATSRLEALRQHGASEVDLNLDQLAATGELRAPSMDLDVGAALPVPPADRGMAATQRLGDTEPEPEPATMSEVGTKLDLARAYMDMGDPEGARSILEEVLSEGSASQKSEARRLIESLPG